jgi:hypothetical protein
MKFFAAMMLLRVGAGGGLVWLRLHPADWSPFAFYGLRGLCCAVVVATLTRRFVILRPANRPWWRFSFWRSVKWKG